jgi:hypothetical protein
MGLLLWAMGCAHDRPAEYGRQRPPVDELDPRDRGLQSKDLIEATDLMAQSLLTLPELQLTDRQWTIVATGVRNQTLQQRQSYDIFVDRLKTSIGKYGRGRVQLIEQRDTFRDLQARELEPGFTDEFQQGGSRPAPGPAGIQPEYALYGTMQEMPNRGTSLFRAEFQLVNLRDRRVVWTDDYLVRVAR